MTTDFEESIEKEIQEKGLTAARVTKAHIDALFAKLTYTVYQIAPTRMIVSAALDGFFVADGFSACVSPENFNYELGARIAKERCEKEAFNKLWELEGYRLSRMLHTSAPSEAAAA